MAMPRQVAAGAAEADQALKAFLSAGTPESLAPSTPPPANEPAAAPAAPAAAAPPAPAPAPQVTPTNDSAELQRLGQQLSSLQGMFSSQQNALNAALEEANRLRREAAAAAAAPAAAAPAPLRLLTEDEEKEYGPAFLDVVRRAVREDIMPIIQPLLGRLERLESGVTAANRTATHAAQAVAMSAEEKFWADVNRLVPNYDAINVDQRFLNWLQERPRYSKNTKHELLIQAAEGLDAEQVASFYTDFVSAAGVAPTPAPTAVQAPTPTAPAADPAADLIAPSAASAPGTPTPDQIRGQIWTMADVDELYRRQSKGLITAADFAMLETDMKNAVAEGRFRG
jgi:hypothetical protein